MKTSLTRKIKRRGHENFMKANYGEIHELDSFYDNYLTMLYRTAEFDHTTEVEGIVNTLTNVLSVIAIGSGLFIISGGVFGFAVPGYVITAGQVAGGILTAKDIGHLMTGKDINGNPLSEVDKRAIISSLAIEGSMLAVSSFIKLKLKYANKVDGLKIIDGKVMGKIPIDDFKRIRAESIKNIDSDTMTLGKYIPMVKADGTLDWTISGKDSYIVKAGNTTYFSLGSDWDVIKDIYII